MSPLFQRFGALVALVALLGLSVSLPARAADAVVGTGTPASCTQSALLAAVSTANTGSGGTITFNCGASPHTIALTQQLRFDRTGATYVLDGGGLITLDGGHNTRLIYTASGRGLNFTVRNITLTRGRAAFDPDGERAANQGGAIYSGYENRLTVENVTFSDNRARAERHPYHGGGAIAVDTTSIVRISDSTFLNNVSPNGGAINNLLSVLTIERSRFVGNQSTSPEPGGGGAIYNDAGKLTIRSSHIFDNRAENLGGGIFTWAHNVNGSYSGKTLIRNTAIDGNHAERGSGGGLWKGGSYRLDLVRSSVTNNTALTRGAGISGTGPGTNFRVVNSTIAYNRILNEGSAAGLFSANAPSTVVNSTIAFNTMPGGEGSVSVGAAIHGNVTLTNTVILGNTGGWNGVWSCMGTITNGGRNLQHPSNTCGGGIPTTNARLTTTLVPARASLALGQTQTLAPELDSPAVNAGANCPAVDQRGVARPQGAACDIGAHELEGAPPAPITFISPANGATEVSRRPVATWTHSVGAVRYQLTVLRPNGEVFYTATRKAANLGCNPVCIFDFAVEGARRLQANRNLTLAVRAINPFGKPRTAISFTTGE